MPIRMQLPAGEPDPRKRYSMSDPDACQSALSAVYRHRYYEEREPTPEEVGVVLSLAADYVFLTTYPLGQEHCVGKLRDIWRARREREENTDAA